MVTTWNFRPGFVKPTYSLSSNLTRIIMAIIMSTRQSACYKWTEDRCSPAPVVCKRLGVLSVKSSCRGEHDGGVQIGDDAWHGAGSSDAGLSTAITRLKSGQHVRHLWDKNTDVRLKYSYVCWWRRDLRTRCCMSPSQRLCVRCRWALSWCRSRWDCTAEHQLYSPDQYSCSPTLLPVSWCESRSGHINNTLVVIWHNRRGHDQLTGERNLYGYLITLCSHGSTSGLWRQVTKLCGQLIGQTAQLIRVVVGFGHLVTANVYCNMTSQHINFQKTNILQFNLLFKMNSITK